MIDRTDRDRYPHQIQLHPIHPYSGVAGDHHNQYSAGGKSGYSQQERPSVTRVLIVLSLVPVGGSLLVLAGLTLTGVLIGLAVTTPLFIIFSPVLIPAAIIVSLAITAFLASGAFGLTGLSSLSWVLNYFRRATGFVPEQLEYYAKRHMLDVTAYAGQKTKDVGQEIQNKALEAKRT